MTFEEMKKQADEFMKTDDCRFEDPYKHDYLYEEINYFEKIREYLNMISNISNKLASDITETDLAKLDAYSCGIWALVDSIESEMKEGM